jgi:NAD(P)-dependent dehydrogenase (short-subunit alcohol dehydrogenase family)
VNPFDDIHGQRILVTGASSGIGRAVCVLLSQLGAKLILVGRSEERLAETALMLDGTGHAIEPKDLSQADTIPAWMKQLVKDTGPLNGVVHSAGIQGVSPVRFLKDEDFSHMMNVNVNSAVQLAKGFRQKGVRGEAGSIVLLSSVIGIVGQAGVAAYSASKGAVCALTRSIAIEFAAENIRVNCIAPGIVKTEMTQDFQSKLSEGQFNELCDKYPLGIGEPRDIANAIVFLLSNTGRWITGTTLVVDGGYTAH